MVSSYEAFLEGVKPSAYENLDMLSQSELIPALKKHPAWNECENFWMFFQSEGQKERFLSQYLHSTDSEQHRLLGLELGYPPRAVDFYVKILHETSHPTVGVHYHGYNFTSCIHDLEENIKWLWSTHKIVDSVEVRFNQESYQIRHLDINDLQTALEEVHKKTNVLESAM
ncbi:IS4 transposase [Croceifilum oryzae]|uniref:IS4 transposase n=1 Tax=Croceifilum oryzae TaxID=1553429 RepID=A0AAJ1WTL0_9BACL|nr:hypothetical protein [Croceifilum oryzae]MDQ0418153.1 IS4 transposase [Croceifilum oryzae]